MVTDDYILNLKEYFDMVGNLRVGKYMTELRHLVVKELSENGFRPTHIRKITGMKHDKQHYLLSDKYSNISESDYIKENMHQWIADKLFPCSDRIYVKPFTDRERVILRLSPDPTTRYVPTKGQKGRPRINSDIDDMLRRLNI